VGNSDFRPDEGQSFGRFVGTIMEGFGHRFRHLDGGRQFPQGNPLNEVRVPYRRLTYSMTIKLPDLQSYRVFEHGRLNNR
jgi:hypothetical protein